MKGIPFLGFDAGGVPEMFDPKGFEVNVVFKPTLAWPSTTALGFRVLAF